MCEHPELIFVPLSHQTTKRHTMDNKLKPYLIMGAGLFIGLGTGFFLLPNGVAFVGAIILGMGAGLLGAAFFK